MSRQAFWVIFKKELKDLFRDRKTLIVGILLPLVMFPLIYGLMGKSVDSSTKKVAENLKVAIEDKGDSSLGKFLKSQANITKIDSTDIKKDVQEGVAYIGIVIPEDFDKRLREERAMDVKLLVDDTSQSSTMAEGIIKGYIEGYSKEIVKTRLEARNIDVSILSPVTISQEVVAKEKGGFGKFMLSLMLPMFLIMYAVSSPMAAAIDLGAGEKERGTLEPLLTTQASRMGILFGKLLAITVMGVIGSVASILGLLISFKTAPGIFGEDMALILPPKALILMGVAIVLITMTFGAIELAVSIYARSFKEAQTYLTPTTIIGMAAGFGVYMIDVKNLGAAYFNIPLVNVTLIIKELINGIYNPAHIAITFGWIFVYIAAALLFVRYMFTREEVIFRT